MMQPAPVAQVSADDNSWSRSGEDVLRDLQVDLHQGLHEEEARARLRRYGPNQLHVVGRKSVWSMLVNQVKSVVIVLLIAAAALSISFGDTVEGMAILAVVLVNGVIGFATERHATRSMEALRKLGRVETIARRDGRIARLAAEELVPGDIVVVEGGDIVTADMRVIEASRLQADESTLTGESIPVDKQVHKLAADAALAERRNMLFKGSAVTRGAATAVVVATGMATELGKISQLVTAAKSQATPLERRLDALGRRLAWAVLVIAMLLVVAATFGGRDAILSIQVAIALAVAAIPEGLPIVATIALARGMWRMSKKNALIARLSAVETLGAASVILTDKTGTLTENRMTVTSLHLGDVVFAVEGTGLETRGAFVAENAIATANDLQRVDEMLMYALLCCNAELSVNESGELNAVGDPTETALLIAAAKRNLDHRELLLEMPRMREESFDPQSKSMATYHHRPAEILVAVKGAPEVVLDACTTVRCRTGTRVLTDADRRKWHDRAAALGAQGLRTLSVAGKTVADLSEGPYSRLTLFGIAGLEDPPRRGVRLAIDRCRKAGIRVVMVTGDHAATARHIAQELGMVEADAAPGSFIDARTRLASNGESGIDLMGATVI
jgi:Ca2+-transporting ATPase